VLHASTQAVLEAEIAKERWQEGLELALSRVKGPEGGSASGFGSCWVWTVCWLASHSNAIGTVGRPAWNLMEIASLRYFQVYIG